MNARKDYYSVLGVSSSADEVALGAAYRTLLKKYHPDVYRGSREKAESKTREIVEAYDTLRDSAKRRVYDATRVGRRRQNAGRRPSRSASDVFMAGAAFRSNRNASSNRTQSNRQPYGPKALWPLLIVGILGLILAAKVLYYGL
jgi:DnaJ-class molecular chaperone